MVKTTKSETKVGNYKCYFVVCWVASENDSEANVKSAIKSL